MRSAVKKDINATCAEFVYGTTLRLPSDLFSTDKITTTCNQTYVSFLRENMRALQPIPTSAHSNSSMFVPTKLKSCSHVFLRIDNVQPPLSQNYTGPHKDLEQLRAVLTRASTLDAICTCVRFSTKATPCFRSLSESKSDQRPMITITESRSLGDTIECSRVFYTLCTILRFTAQVILEAPVSRTYSSYQSFKDRATTNLICSSPPH
ncbi:transposon Tf2-11 polyprotein [Trichonephila clavipes]|nr:transposon Tf2-11 polyprotein [Trichonephila clavipes]